MSVFDKLKELKIENYKTIDEQAIREITLGASILATGGGGDPEIGLLWTLKVFQENKPVIMVDPMDLPEYVMGAGVGCLGATVVLTEKPPSDDVLITAFEKLEQYTNKKFEVVIPFEAGGVNSTVAYAIAGELGIPVVDVDGMNRAF